MTREPRGVSKPLQRRGQAVLRVVAPKLYWRIKLARLRRHRMELEVDLLPFLVPRNKTSLDVGAARGDYVARLIDQSARVVAFEPRREQALALAQMAGALGLPLRVECVALSDVAGHALLRTLIEDPGRSSIEASNLLDDPDGGRIASAIVPTSRLDDFGLDDVGFIKIDVEGHEIAVLRGSAETIAAARCALLVEAENRHAGGSPAEVITLMSTLGYAGYFLLGDRVVDARRFDPDMHQRPENIGGYRTRWERSGVYVNNFIFVPQERAKRFLEDAAGTGLTVEQGLAP